jgi:hypothetical protein
MQEQAARRLAERLLGSDPEVGIAGSKKTPGALYSKVAILRNP